jgi:hypothetical protein
LDIERQPAQANLDHNREETETIVIRLLSYYIEMIAKR